jgi:hypothetical protein
MPPTRSTAIRSRTPDGGSSIAGNRLGAQIDASELLQELRGATLLDPRHPVHDDVLAQTWRLDLGALERDGEAGLAPDVLELSQIRVEVGGEQIFSLDRRPDAGHLGSAVRIDRDQMAQRARLDQLPWRCREGPSRASLGVRLLATLDPAAPWRSGYAAACKAVYTGSIPVGASSVCRGFASRAANYASIAPPRSPLGMESSGPRSEASFELRSREVALGDPYNGL